MSNYFMPKNHNLLNKGECLNFVNTMTKFWYLPTSTTMTKFWFYLFTFVSEKTVLKILQGMDENKTAGLDNLSGKFLKDGATVLAKPISRICNLSIKYSIILLISKIMVKNKSNWLVLKQLSFKTAVFVCQPLSQIIARVSSNQLVFLERSLLCGTFTSQLHVKSSVNITLQFTLIRNW